MYFSHLDKSVPKAGVKMCSLDGANATDTNVYILVAKY
jgi:hypothetical protein